MPKPKSSEEARILRYFREGDLLKAQLLASLVMDAIKSRTPKAVAPKTPKVSKKKGPEAVAARTESSPAPAA